MSSVPELTPEARCARAIAREHFLAAVQTVAPRALTYLEGEPLALRDAIMAREFPAGSRFECWHEALFQLTPADLQRCHDGQSDDSLLCRLAAALDRWQRLFHLSDAWFLDAAAQTLGWWCMLDPNLNPRRWHYDDFPEQYRAVAARIGPQGFAINLAAAGTWIPGFEDDRETVRRRLMAEFGRQLSARLDAIEEVAKRAGLVATPRKTADAHFEWLAAFLVEGESQTSLARAHGTSRQTVHAALTATAALVGLSLRPAGAPGRPRH